MEQAHHDVRARASLIALFLTLVVVLTTATQEAVHGGLGVLGERSTRGATPLLDGTSLSFSVSGTSPSLVPGTSQQLSLTISNPNPFAIRVMSISATVADAGDLCPGSGIVVGPLAAPADVPARGSSATTLSVGASPGMANACQGMTFVLRFSGTDVRVAT